MASLRQKEEDREKDLALSQKAGGRDPEREVRRVDQFLHRKVAVRLTRKRKSNFHGARPVTIIPMMK